MIHAGPYQNDYKARLHKYLTELTKKIENRANIKNIELDSYIISVTPYEKLKETYDDGTWDLDKFSNAHILFFEQNINYNYINYLIN